MEENTGFCPVCGRQHVPGPCPIPSVEPKSPTWESDQYRRLGFGGLVTGAIVFIIAILADIGSMLFLAAGLFFLLMGVAGLVVARQKRAGA